MSRWCRSRHRSLTDLGPYEDYIGYNKTRGSQGHQCRRAVAAGCGRSESARTGVPIDAVRRIRSTRPLSAVLGLSTARPSGRSCTPKNAAGLGLFLEPNKIVNVSEMFSSSSGPVDISELVFAAQRRIRGKDKTRALAEIVVASHWQPKSRIREAAEDIIRTYPLQHMFSTVQLSSTCKVAATASAGTPMESEIPQDRLNAAMCQQYKMFFPFAATGTIEPMRNELLMAHCVSLSDIAQLVDASPNIPRGRGVLFTIGIHAGLQGRFIESLHVLIPQLENMLRCWLFDSKLISSTINHDGIQREMNLNQILELSATESLISEDLCYVLRALFTEQFGHNLRNEMAHGMLSPGSCFSDAAIYAWWLIFHMVALPVAIAIIEGDEDFTGEATRHGSNAPTANSTEPPSPPSARPLA
jgi:uncharacterized protein DUF4209